MRYRVDVTVFSGTHLKQFTKFNLSETEAWRYARSQARKGVREFGGSVQSIAWGVVGGIPEAYRSAGIRRMS